MDQFKLYQNCEIIKVENKAQEIEIILKNEVTKSSCPYCEQESDQTHGYYKRNLRDLPIGGREIIISLWVRRFLCANTKCSYKTFGARLEGIVERHAQRSERLIEAHLAIAIKLGGEAGSDLATELGMRVSADSLLRAIKATNITTSETPRVLGIDDWAIRRRERYGTILVDLEKHKVVDILEGRDAQTLAEWLDTHPGVEIITRDRSNEYAKAVKEAAPDAQQVADRWHLLKNVQEMLEKWLRTVQTRLSTLSFEGTLKTQAQQLFDLIQVFQE